ncbi:phosphoglycolate phosphatase-like HAD superfamily hydrolase [Herbihabitans rhizosphaerae]|uniref:Phosphoglycolate phosphatase-like HAD superfamily hydrolase n=1 Tax=Herbihabitans rhizosphaerae TaxID=1872711 RepID=A0A4Q7L846_9PSEU|nr:HAD hydrolase-like protein [Herbihabitans rhizosphaerae]RZS45090.1 phosphoglycolate phosphatase-like HAD superfamily hydrolase [Herbihabitans rhizosphaerae]
MTAREQSPRTLLLWDIDHTLIETRGVGRAIYDRAFPAATGRPLTNLATIAGRTELEIMRESLRCNNIEPTAAMIERLATALVQGYEDARDELATTGRTLPGAKDTLATLAANPAVFQTALTGNLREVARIKLEVFGLVQFLDLEAGAYGDDHHERAELVAIAQERASKRAGVAFTNDATVLIGDTPNDVAAGLTAGVRVIAVATGKSTSEELQSAGATAVVHDAYALAQVLSARG